MHFSVRGYLFVVLAALLGVAGTWSEPQVARVERVAMPTPESVP